VLTDIRRDMVVRKF